MIKCPVCNGDKQCFVFENKGINYKNHTSGYRPCPTCKGVGEITEEHKARIDNGKELRAKRYERKETLIECAKRMGISIVELSAIENGRSV